MENNEQLDKFFSEKMSSALIPEPPLALVEAARKKVALRQKQRPHMDDLFSLLASFLNLRIKLYHAVIATVVIVCCIAFWPREDGSPDSYRDQEAHETQYVSNIAAVRNSTVLSSINTFVLRK